MKNWRGYGSYKIDAKNKHESHSPNYYANGNKGNIPSIDDLLNPAIEQEDADLEVDNFSDGDKGLIGIATYVQTKWSGEVLDEVEEEKEEEDSEPLVLDCTRALAAAEFLGQICNEWEIWKAHWTWGGFYRSSEVKLHKR